MPSPFDPFKGIKVEIVSEGSPLVHYDDPDSAEDGGSSDHYSRNYYTQGKEICFKPSW